MSATRHREATVREPEDSSTEGGGLARRNLVAALFGTMGAGVAASLLANCAGGEPGEGDKLGRAIQAATLTGSISGANTVADIATTVPVPAPGSSGLMVLEGYHAVADGGGGVFFWTFYGGDGGAPPPIVDNGTIFADANNTGVWIRIFSGAINVKWFGAYGDGVHDDHGAIQGALDACHARGGGTVLIPATTGAYAPDAGTGGAYLVGSTLTVRDNTRVVGEGEQSYLVIAGTSPANSFYLFNLTGSCLGVANLQITAASLQTACGAFDYTNAIRDVHVEDIIIVENVCTSFNVAPTACAGAGSYFIERIHWIGGANYTCGITVGNAGCSAPPQVSDVHIRDCLAHAGGGTNPYHQYWLSIAGYTDTVTVTGFECEYGLHGVIIGSVGSASPPTGVVLERVIADLMAGYGFELVSARDLKMQSCHVNTCGSTDASIPGILVAKGCQGVLINGVTVQCCKGHGIVIDGPDLTGVPPNYISVSGCIVTDNCQHSWFTTNHVGAGIFVMASATNFSLTGNTLGNLGFASGGQQYYGIYIDSGATAYVVAMNRANGLNLGTAPGVTIVGTPPASAYVAGNI